MEEKEKDRNPKPGIAEAIHMEIGNGALWEAEPHPFLLRNPDPSKELDERLMDQESRDQILKAWAKTVKNGEPDESLATEEMPANRDQPFVVQDPQTVQDQVSFDTTIQPVIPLPLPVIKEKPLRKSKKKASTDSGQDEPTFQGEEIITPEPRKEKPVKAGKLVKKAAKTIRRKEKEGLAPEIKEIPVTSESILSPYTQWLKSLKGSDYVHPYDDDFAIHQGSGPLKEGISETFADLLAAQGYKDRAIEMYMKLMAKYPEKSGFFAAKIEALQ